LASIGLGIGLAGGVRRGRYLGSDGWFSARHEAMGFHSLGLALEVQTFFPLLPSFGLGFLAFADFNFERSFGGG
jgi:hypothetical protein